MPPLLDIESESENASGSEDLDTIPSHPAKQKTAKAAPAPVNEDVVEETQEANGADEESEEEDGEEFAVEKILKHDYAESGAILYQVKWVGYEAAKDRTWEPRENLESGAAEILKAYHKSLRDGTPEPERPKKTPAKGAKGTKRKSENVATESPAPKAKRGRKSDANGEGWVPPTGSWEKEINSIETLEEGVETDGKGKKQRALYAYVHFNDGVNKGRFSIETLRQKCPQRLLDYFISHLYVHRKRFKRELSEEASG